MTKAHQTLVRIDSETGKRIMKDKKTFTTFEDAVEAARRLNAKPTQIHQLVAYKCDTCWKFHIGRSGRKLKGKEEILRKFYGQ